VATEQEIAQIRERAHIVEIISHYVALKKMGRSYRGLCPFHNERSPSFYVNPDKGLFYCFGCQASGDVFAFLMKHQHQSFKDTLTHLAAQLGIHLSAQVLSDEALQQKKKNDTLYLINQYVADYFEHMLQSSQEGQHALQYLEQRRISTHTARQFNLGYAPTEVTHFLDYCTHKKIPTEPLFELGILGQKQAGRTPYLRLFGRLIFPIHDERGRVAGFGGRSLNKESTKTAKYINSQESTIYKKSHILYGFFKAKDKIARQNCAHLCEGYIDVIALHQAGFDTAVAPLGTAITLEHVQLLKKSCHRIVTVFDGDAAGYKATQKASELFLSQGLHVRVLPLPAGDDPDTFVQREGPQKMQTNLNEAPHAVSYLIQQTKADLVPTIDGRVRAVERIMPLLKLIQSPLEKNLYTQEAARSFSVDESFLRDYLKQQTRPKKQPEFQQEESTLAPIPTFLHDIKPDPSEWMAVREILKYRILWDILQDIEPLLDHPGLKKIVTLCKDDDSILTFELLCEYLGDTQLARELSSALSDDLSAKLDQKQMVDMRKDLTLHLLHQQKQRELWQITQQIKQAYDESKDVPEMLIKKKSELLRWLKQEQPRLKL